MVSPDGSYLTEPVLDDPSAVFADLDPRLVEEQRMTMDVDGHYSRPDVFTLHVNRKRQRNVEQDTPGDQSGGAPASSRPQPR